MELTMLRVLILTVVLSMAATVVTAGGAGSTGTEDGAAVYETVPCEEPRPRICTQDYRPVCAFLADGSTKTYANGCTACSDPDVEGHREGVCDDGW